MKPRIATGNVLNSALQCNTASTTSQANEPEASMTTGDLDNVTEQKEPHSKFTRTRDMECVFRV